MDKKLVEDIVRNALNEFIELKNIRPLGGGCINNAVRLDTSAGNFFLKSNDKVPDNFFQVEAKSLEILTRYYPGTIPKPIAYGSRFLLTEFVESDLKQANFWKKLGENLAELHQHSNDHFGLDFDNYIGSLPQYNGSHKNWVDFFVEERIQRQINLAQSRGLGDRNAWEMFDTVIPKFSSIFPNEKPALIHGDLWSGNLMVDSEGLPALIDPAIYFGNRETELAFTQLFGGFDRSFLEAYDDRYPLEPDFDERIYLHNLYPLLVHLNLFGNSYLGQIKKILRRFL